MSLIKDSAARFKAPPPADHSVTTVDTGCNVVPLTAKPSPGLKVPVADPPEGAHQQLQKIFDETDPETWTEDQKDAAAAAKLVRERAQKFAEKFTPFRDEEDAFYILEKDEAVRLDSTHCVDILRDAAMNGGPFSFKLTKDSLELVQTMLRTEARAEPHKTVNRRIAKDGDAYQIDLGGTDRRCVRVDANGITVAKAVGPIFSRGKGYGELPEPVIPNDADQAWQFVQPLLAGIPSADRFPLIAVMVEGLRSDTPHPLLILVGQEGSGKSTVADRCTMAIDPFDGQPPSVAHNERAFYSAAQTRHTLTMDNLSEPLKGGLEDVLCRSSYGAAITVPMLYTTCDSLTLRLFVRWIITGISNNIRQADTLDRAWVIRVEKPTTGYRSPDKLRAEFKMAHGQVLGGLLWFLAERMRRAPGIEATQNIRHRLVDFLVTGEAVSQSLGNGVGEFIAAVERKRSTSAQDWLKYDPFAGPLVKCLAELIRTKVPAAGLASWRTWHKQPGYSVFQVNGRRFIAATADAIHLMVSNATLGLTGKEAACIPTSAPAAADALDRIQNQMTRAGWTVRRQPVNGGNNTIWVFGAAP